MKKILSLSLFVILVGGIILLKNQTENFVSDSSDEWTTYTKEAKVVVQRPSSPTELKKIGVTDKKAKPLIPKRSLSSVQVRPKNYETYKGRRIIGHIKKDIKDMNFINTIDENWKKKLSLKLLQHRDDEATLLINKEKSVIKLANGTARYLELVNVSFLFKGDDSNSFKAFVDSETGEILQTWSQSIHDRVGAKELKLTPDGTL